MGSLCHPKIITYQTDGWRMMLQGQKLAVRSLCHQDLGTIIGIGIASSIEAIWMILRILGIRRCKKPVLVSVHHGIFKPPGPPGTRSTMSL